MNNNNYLKVNNFELMCSDKCITLDKFSWKKNVLNMFNETRECDSNTYKIFKYFANKKENVVDIGAYNGLYTSFFLGYLFNHVYAIECDPYAIKSFELNYELNKYKNITLHKGAIAHYNGEIYIGEGGKKRKFGSSGITIMNNELEKNKIKVNAITIDKLFEKYKIKNCHFIKMDIEGGEYFVIPQIKDFLKKNKITLYLSLHHHLYKNTDGILESLKYSYGEQNIYDPLTLKNFYNINIIKTPHNTHGRDILCTFKKIETVKLLNNVLEKKNLV